MPGLGLGLGLGLEHTIEASKFFSLSRIFLLRLGPAYASLYIWQQRHDSDIERLEYVLLWNTPRIT